MSFVDRAAKFPEKSKGSILRVKPSENCCERGKKWVKFALEFQVDDPEISVDDRKALTPNRQNS
jgi:hypothetical protein